MPNDDKLRLLATVAEASAEIRKLWDNSALGLALVTKFYSDDPWASAAELAEASDLSEDTVRRKLRTLATIGRVRTGRRGRITVYKAQRDWASRTDDIINSLLLAAKCG
jgi:Fic family protein